MPLQDSFSAHYAELLTGDYDCVDRIVLNGYFLMGQTAGGFRTWWRKWMDSDETLDNAHLMRLAGRFSRRVRAWAQSRGVPVIDCKKGERKHELAEKRLPSDPQFTGVFCILVGRAEMPLWDVKHCGQGGIHLCRKKAYVNHYSFHIMDAEWGHVTFKVCGHPPFNTQILLNGHEYVARRAAADGLQLRQESNCFTEISDARGLSQIADTLCHADTAGRLRQVCERWIYSACLCFALSVEDQRRSGFRYDYSLYQAEYSRNLLFERGRHMEQVVQGLIDRTRSALDLKTIKTLFGLKQRPGKRQRTRFEATVETPEYHLTIFKVRYGRLTLKVYTKGERLLRIEAMVHNTAVWRCRRSVENYPEIVSRLSGMLARFLEVLRCVDSSWITDDTWETLPQASQLGATRVAGVNLNHPRMRAVCAGVLALATQPGAFTAGDLAAHVAATTRQSYTPRQAAYDLRKLRAKRLLDHPSGRRYHATPDGLRILAAWVTLRDNVLQPLLANVGCRHRGRTPKHDHILDNHHRRIQADFQQLFKTLQIAA